MIPLVVALVVVALLLAYAAGAARLRLRGDRWPVPRDLAWAGGCVALAAAVLPPLGAHHGSFTTHVAGHLLLASVAPVLFALAAPLTLALRVLPARPRRGLLRVLRGPVPAVAGHPAVVVVLTVVPLYVLYLTPLYALTQRDALWHLAVHAHMLLAGCLLAWYLVGVDPVRHRPTVSARLAVLFLVAGSHDVLAKLLYARLRPVGGGSADQIRAGAQLLYYGGDAVEVALAVLVLATWYRSAAKRTFRTRPTELMEDGGRAAGPSLPRTGAQP